MGFFRVAADNFQDCPCIPVFDTGVVGTVEYSIFLLVL